MLKTVTFAPIPIPRVNTAITVKPGDFSRSRAAWRRSWSMAVGGWRLAGGGLRVAGGGWGLGGGGLAVGGCGLGFFGFWVWCLVCSYDPCIERCAYVVCLTN